MQDIVSPETRSRMMAAIPRRNTLPELLVRRWLHAQGFRFRLDVAGLPGRPDIVLRRWHAAIFVHGCFWHRHGGCRFATIPSTRADVWFEKFERNIVRDMRAVQALHSHGWRVGVVWECSLRREVREETLSSLVDWLQGNDRTFSSDEARRP